MRITTFCEKNSMERCTHSKCLLRYVCMYIRPLAELSPSLLGTNHMHPRRAQARSEPSAVLPTPSFEACRSSLVLRFLDLGVMTTKLPGHDLAHGDRPLCLLATGLHILSILGSPRVTAPKPF